MFISIIHLPESKILTTTSNDWQGQWYIVTHKISLESPDLRDSKPVLDTYIHQSDFYLIFMLPCNNCSQIPNQF